MDLTQSELEFPISYLKSIDYRWGGCQAIHYDRQREDIFPGPSYLVRLYELCRQSGRAKLGILEPLFCGCTDLSCEAVVKMLQEKPLTVLGEWRERQAGRAGESPTEFVPLGFCFPVSIHPFPIPPSPPAGPSCPVAAFGAYAFFQSAWRTPQQTVLTWLGISYLFAEYNLVALHGTRYAWNGLTARWMAKFGFRDVATMPSILYRKVDGVDKLEDGVVSTLSREVFEARLRSVLSEV